jgi:hypothetical protein
VKEIYMKEPFSMASSLTKAKLILTDKQLSTISWSTSAMLLGFLCLTHLGVMITFLTSHSSLPLVIPIALVTAIFLGDRMAKREGLKGKLRLWPLSITFGLTILSVMVASWFYDLCWDGQWYHQVAIYRLSEGWNPIMDSLHTFQDDTELWIRHYAKGPWYASTAMMSLTGYIESGKFLTWLALASGFLAVAAACLDAGISCGKAVIVGAVAALNPVTTTQMYAFMVDGLMICYMACYTAALFSGIRRFNPLTLFVGITSGICCINSKSTGLVFLCFITAGAGLYCLLKKRELFWKFAGINLGIICIGILLFGYNPYITNTINRGNPFYPYMGSKAYPSLEELGEEGIEKWETPKNLLDHTRIVRHAMALFGQPGVQPYNDGLDAIPMWPFAVPFDKLVVYSTHEVRVAGFGPLFSGVLLLALVLIGWIIMEPGMPRGMIILALATLILSLLISPHTWWARYGPQMYWIPFVPVVAIFWASQHRIQIIASWGLVTVLLVNALLVAGIHLNWEIMATRTLHRQLTELQVSGEKIEVDFQWFYEAASKRFVRWGIPYTRIQRDQANDGKELMTVVAGYPGTIHYRAEKKQ